MNSLILKSPAKINLTLRVLRRRPDGYHELATLFHRISLCDTLRLKKTKNFSLHCSNPELSTGEDNLITKAYRALQSQIPNLGGVSVSLTKKIPLGAGLGGGSSNAASFLLGMKKLYQLKISSRKLAAIGAKLGADIPFFIHNLRQALGLERGDRIQNKSNATKHTFLLAASHQGLSTRAVYENLRGKIPALPAGRQAVSLTKVTPEITILCAFLAKKKYVQAGKYLKNDLERSAFELRPTLRKILESFKKRGLPLARMTGSGPTIFAVCPSLREANRAQKKLQQDLPSCEILLCQSL